MQRELHDTQSPSAACEEPGADCFLLIGVVIEGAHAISASELANAYEPWLAERVRIEDLARIAVAITDLYRARGYFLSRAIVPPQDGAGGVARILVLEGRFEDVAIEGDAADAVAPFLRGLEHAPIADLRELDRRLARASDIPGVSIRSRIEPDPQDPRLHHLIVSADLKRFALSAALDNRGSDGIGPWQLYARGAWSTVLRGRDEATLALFTTPADPSEYTLLEGGYSIMLENGARIGLGASASLAHDGANASTSDIGGEGQSATLRYEQPLYRRRNVGLWVGAGFDARHIAYDWTTGGAYADELRVLRVDLRGFLDDEGRSSTFAAQVSFGLDVLGASGASTARSRADADARFSKLNLRLTHYTPIGGYFGLFASVDAQATNEPLLASEEYSVGGLPYGRAYDYGELSGDNGVAGSLELRAGYDPHLGPITFLQGYAFGDVAQVWNFNAAPDSLSLSSAGLGLRVTLMDMLTARLESARPLSRTPAAEGDKDWRHFFSLTANY